MVTHFIVRHLRTSIGLIKSHYETLGITPSASQAEVKAAYYKKSMELHPDRVQGNREHFEEVANAYKILSDPSIRKLYDGRKGVGGENNSSCDSRPRTGFRPQFGKTPVYDFDQWTRRHYGGVIKRRETRKDDAHMKDFLVGEREKENVAMALMFIMLLGVFITVVNADQRMSPQKKPERKRSSSPGKSSEKKPPDDL